MIYDGNGNDLMNKAILKENDNAIGFICGTDYQLRNSLITNYQRFVNPFSDVSETNEGMKNRVIFSNGSVMSKSINNNNVTINTNVMPDIVDVQTIENNGKVKVVTVYFADGTNEKAILSDEDTYSLEQGISICITKKLLSDKTAGYGSSVYNKIINHAMKVMNKNKKYAEKRHEAEETLKNKLAKLAKKKADKKAKREADAREEAISIQTEAYLRAMREFNNTSATK